MNHGTEDLLMLFRSCPYRDPLSYTLVSRYGYIQCVLPSSGGQASTGLHLQTGRYTLNQAQVRVGA